MKKKLTRSDAFFYLASVDPNWRNLSFTQQRRQVEWYLQKENKK